MARVRTCPACDTASAASEPFCKCGTSLAFAPEADELHQQVFPEVRDAQSPVRKTRAFLSFPWGEEEIVNEMCVGRDLSLPLAPRIGNILTVSRFHAVISVQDGRLWMRHLSATNATTVRERVLGSGEEVELLNGDEVTFSKALRARVRIS